MDDSRHASEIWAGAPIDDPLLRDDERESSTKVSIDEALAADADVTPTTSLALSMFNLANTTLGAGIVSIPFFFSQCGLVLGTALLLAIAWLSAIATMLQVEAAEATGKWSYMDLAFAAYGIRGVVSLQVTILCLTLGVLSAFFVQVRAIISSAFCTVYSCSYSFEGY